jgi:iron complex transport system ATP-binding protein
MNPLIEAKNISFHYDNNDGNSFSLNDINFSIDRNEFISIIGRNGSGKSTLIKLLARIFLKYKGEIRFDGKEIHEIDRKEYSRNVAYLPQTTLLLNENLKVEEFLSLGRYAYKNFNDFTFNDHDRNIINESMKISNVQNFREKRLYELSGGEKQKILLTLSLVQLDITGELRGKVLIIDEPITYLDINHQYEIFNLLKMLQGEKGLTVLIVIHDLNLSLKFSGKAILMNNGRLEFFDNTENVITEEILKEKFFINSKIILSQQERSINILS